MGEAIYPKVRLFTMRVRLFHGQSHFLSSWSELLSEEFIKGTDTQTHRRTDARTEPLPELLVGAKNSEKTGLSKTLQQQKSLTTFFEKMLFSP